MLLSMLWNVVSVSIHAPVRGATFESDQLIIDHAMVSIHAPVRGATDPPYMQYAVTMFQFTLPCGERLSAGTTIIRIHLSFNSRSRAGSDGPSCKVSSFHGVSIHAPVRGATEDVLIVAYFDRMFQFTLPCGERQGKVIIFMP